MGIKLLKHFLSHNKKITNDCEVLETRIVDCMVLSVEFKLSVETLDCVRGS